MQLKLHGRAEGLPVDEAVEGKCTGAEFNF